MKTRAGLKNRQGGAVAVMVGISIVVLVGFLGLVIDLGHLYVAKTELQNAADACALSAARELSNLDSSALGRATNAGIVAGGGCPFGLNPCPPDAFRNKTDLQAATVDVQPTDVTFSATYGPPSAYGRTDPLPADTKYVRCAPHETNPRSYVMWFMQVMGIQSATVAADAVAKLSPSQSACAIPLGICTKQTAKDSPNPGWGFVKGIWYDGRFGAGGGSTGSYNWIDFSPPNGGASELSALLAKEGQCEVPTSTMVGQSGVDQSIANAWNTHFGLYKGSYDSSANRMDKTGFAYTSSPPPSPSSWPVVDINNICIPAHDANCDGKPDNAYADFQSKHTNAVPYQGDAASGLKLTGSKTSSLTDYQNGTDRRVVAAPIIYCPDWAGSQTALIRGWACMLMLAPIENPDGVMIEFLGLAGESGSPCGTLGLPGGGIGGPPVPTLVK